MSEIKIEQAVETSYDLASLPGIELSDSLDMVGADNQFVVIKRVVLKYYNVNFIDICRKSRSIQWVVPRHTIMYFCRKKTPFSYSYIASHFQGDYERSGQDHTTIINAIKKIQNRIDTDKSFANSIKIMDDEINKHPLFMKILG